MATDARIAVGLPAHPKTKKLVKRLGQAAAWNLVCLILWVASNRSDGDLSGMSTEDIELASDWEGEEGSLVAALVAVRFIDGAEGAYVLHDWEEHNPWAAGAEKRSAKARWNAAKRHHGVDEADRLVPEYAAVRSATSNATSNDSAEEQETGSNAPSPSPSPSPSPNPNSVPNGTGGKPPMTPDEIIFGFGVGLLCNAGTSEKQARSFLGGLRKAHGDDAVINALRDCAKSKPLQPLEWLAAALPPKARGSPDESPYQKLARERVSAWAPSIAKQAPNRALTVIDEVPNVPSISSH